jgi:hypothetical protein
MEVNPPIRQPDTEVGDLADPLAMLDRYAPAIRSLTPGLISFEKLAAEFTLLCERRLRVCYAPFGGINREARTVIVGITPGLYQTQVVMESVRRSLISGEAYPTALSRGEVDASFAGQMRTNLCRMLDQLGLAARLGIESTSEFFGRHARLCNSTSAVRYPAFVDGQNYTGRNPDILRSPVLRRFVDQVLATELALFPHALIVPCGDSVSACLAHIGQTGRIDTSRVLVGFPHPSGGNGHRVRLFADRRETMAAKVRQWDFG